MTASSDLARSVLALILLLMFPAMGHAKNNCPWLNEATASGLLGADAVGEFNFASADVPSTCTFTAQDGAVTRTLRIAIVVASDFVADYRSATQKCGASSMPIQAIGNEAIACSADDPKGQPGERVVGRVRNQVFTITMSSNSKSDLVFTHQNLKTRIYIAAELVAGNLF
jgi:hypothetical protein